MKSTDAIVVDYVAARELMQRLRRDRAGCLCDRAELFGLHDDDELRAELARDPGDALPPATKGQEVACWKAARRRSFDPESEQVQFYLDPLPATWCTSCQERERIHDALEKATRRHSGMLRAIIARGRAIARRPGGAS